MKVCMLVTNSLRKDPRVQREAMSAYKNGIDTVVIGCNDTNYSQEFLDALPYRTVIYMLPLKYRGKLRSIFKKFLRMVLPLIEMERLCVAEKPDLIHANDFDTLPAAVRAAKKLKCAVIYDSHEIYTEQPSLKKYPFIKKVIQCMEKHYIKKIDAMLSVSNAAAAELARKYNITKPTVITNAVNHIEENRLREKAEGFEVIYHGIVNAYRGYEEFAEAARYAGDVTFVIRGYGDRLGFIGDMKERYSLSNLRIDGPVEISELVPAASRSHVGAVLTRPVSDNFKYTVSNKVFEYVQARIPVIMSDIPEHRYLNEKYHFGIIIEDVTPQAVAEAAQKLCTDTGLYESLRRNVRAMADEMCWENEEKRLIEVYKKYAKAW